MLVTADVKVLLYSLQEGDVITQGFITDTCHISVLAGDACDWEVTPTDQSSGQAKECA